MTYNAPVADILHTLKSITEFSAESDGGVYDGLDEETLEAIVEEAGRFGSGVLDPLNEVGDRVGCKVADGIVTTPEGWKQAYQQFVEGGWSTLPCPEEYGGQGLPDIVSCAVGEIWGSANLSFGTCPLLTQGAIDAISIAASQELKDRYLPNLVAGKWTGTMNLTEPQAGSDLSGLKTRAERAEDGSYRISGTKIFITFGEHELAENIIHMVLARLPDAPPGTKGISLFLVPKFIVKDDGSLGERNDVKCIGIEKKLGLHGSPTCVMKFGEDDGAVGYLVGEENRGLAVMFIMMNAARLAVGVQGVALAERATQRAIAYAHERRQGRTRSSGSDGMGPIIEHADVRRMLLTMRALTHAARAICLMTAYETDRSHGAASEEERGQAAHLSALLTPVAKAFSTDVGCEVASIGIQVHGGMGFVEETGAAQYYRDARILPIYEGTNGIQAIDLVARKLPLEGGKVIAGYLEGLGRIVGEVTQVNDESVGEMGTHLADGLADLEAATRWVGQQLVKNPELALASATPYLKLFGLVAGGCYLAKGALSELRDGSTQSERVGVARFFAENLVTTSGGLAKTVMTGSKAVLDYPVERFG